MKVIFLDIDGVLHTTASLHTHAADTECVGNLNDITDSTGAVIVVSSTWRVGGLEYIRKTLACWGVTGTVVDVTPVLLGDDRGEEISEWLSRHPEVESYVVIDDEDFDIVPHLPRLVKTEIETGITPAVSGRVVAML